MKAYDTVRAAAADAGLSLSELSRSLGRPSNYVANGAARGSTPQADTLAAMLAPCGYVLAAVPCDQVPAGALVIDAPAPPRA